MNFLNSLGKTVEQTANTVGHQFGQTFVDANATGGLLTYFSTSNVVCLVSRQSQKALQIVCAPNGSLTLNGQGVEGAQAFHTHWTVINEGQNIVRLHNNQNYLGINNDVLVLIPAAQGQGPPVGAETRLRVSQINNYVTLESVKEPGRFVAIDQPGYVSQNFAGYHKHFIPRLVYSPYGQANRPVPQHSYRL